RKADLSARERAILDLAVKVALDSGSVEEGDFAPVLTHGLTREDVWDIGSIAAFFALSNRMANFTAMRPNDEFYTLGRK
ncbi:MAG: peroxidase-related enzyme, partial [Burkholderiales bacterium]